MVGGTETLIGHVKKKHLRSCRILAVKEGQRQGCHVLIVNHIRDMSISKVLCYNFACSSCYIIAQWLQTGRVHFELAESSWFNKKVFVNLRVAAILHCSFNQTLWIGEFYWVKIVLVVFFVVFIVFLPIPISLGFKPQLYVSYFGCHFVKLNWRSSTKVSIVSPQQECLYVCVSSDG